MNVLLIQPPIRDFYRTALRMQPIGLACLAASLQLHGHRVEILDCCSARKKPLAIPPELSYLSEYYPPHDRSPFRLYGRYYHFGMGWEQIRRIIKASDADVYGISSSFTPYHGEALSIARIIKELDTRKIVVMGGAHVSADPQGVLKSPLVDYVVLGEGEVRLPLLLEGIEKHGRDMAQMDGIGYRVDGNPCITPLRSFIGDLDALPHPARDLLNPDRYRMGKVRSTMIITSRGCPHGCTYCSTHRVMGTAFRMRSPANIVEEMSLCRDRYALQSFDIEDDNFTFNRARTEQLMQLIIDRFGEHGLELAAMNGISFVSLDEDLIRLMKRAGFKTLNLSLVSTAPSLRETRRRPGAITDFDPVLDAAERAGMNVVAYTILGMPGQTVSEMVETVRYLAGKRVLIGPSIYYPAPGTLLFERCKSEGLLPASPSQWRSSAFPVETKDFSRLDLVTLFRLVRIINFIKGKMSEGILEEGISWRDLSQVLKGRSGVRDVPDAGVHGVRSVGTNCTWADLLLLLLREKNFYSLRMDGKGGMILHREPGSKKVLDLFFDTSWDKAILKERNNGRPW